MRISIVTSEKAAVVNEEPPHFTSTIATRNDYFCLSKEGEKGFSISCGRTCFASHLDERQITKKKT